MIVQAGNEALSEALGEKIVSVYSVRHGCEGKEVGEEVGGGGGLRLIQGLSLCLAGASSECL